MGEEIENQRGDVDMSSAEVTFDNITILKEFGNIANLVRKEDFLETVPKSKIRRVKWVPMFNCLKQGILEEMIQDMSSMWAFENMPDKLEILEKQKEKFCDTDSVLWRPVLGDIKSQLRAHDAANLQKQKKILEQQAKEYETRVNKLRKTVSAKRGFLKALLMDVQNYQKKNDEFITKINDKIDTHQSFTKIIIPNMVDVDEVKWNEKELEINV